MITRIMICHNEIKWKKDVLAHIQVKYLLVAPGSKVREIDDGHRVSSSRHGHVSKLAPSLGLCIELEDCVHYVSIIGSSYNSIGICMIQICVGYTNIYRKLKLCYLLSSLWIP